MKTIEDVYITKLRNAETQSNSLKIQEDATLILLEFVAELGYVNLVEEYNRVRS